MASDQDQINQQILERLDIMDEYRQMGLVFASDHPRSSGMVECYAAGRDEHKPSACVNVKTGRYVDKGGSSENLSLWDFAAKYGGRGKDWLEARRYFAEKVSIEIPTKGRQKSSGGETTDSLVLIDWTEPLQMLASVWCVKYKPGVSLDAIMMADGRIGQYPCWRDKSTNELKGGEYKVLAIPAWGDGQVPPAGKPCCWVMWNLVGPTLPVFRGKGKPVEQVKMKSIGPSRGAMMGAHGLERLASGADCEWVIKSAGPTDMLSVMASTPPELREKNLVVTNASGEAGDVLGWQVNLLRGRRVLLLHDADITGQVGAYKWMAALRNSALEVRQALLPYPVQKKSGLDSRHFLTSE